MGMKKINDGVPKTRIIKNLGICRTALHYELIGTGRYQQSGN